MWCYAPLSASPATRLTVATLVAHRLEPRGHFLFSLDQQLAQVTDDVLVLIVEEGGGETEIANSASTANAVHVLLDVGWQVKVDDMLHMGDVETTGSHLKQDIMIRFTQYAWLGRFL